MPWEPRRRVESPAQKNAKAAVKKTRSSRREAVLRERERERQLLARAVLSIEKQAQSAAAEPSSSSSPTSSERSLVNAESTSPTKHLLFMRPPQRPVDEAALWERAAAIVSKENSDDSETPPSFDSELTDRARQKEAALWAKAQAIIAQDRR
jgi:hypothetical protein